MKKPTPFGKYFLLERINVGGMAEVFRAKAFGVEGFERLVAVKRILPNIAEDKEFIRMFIEEAKLAVQLNHANIAQIFDLGVVDGSYYIALEHVHGRDLRGIFDRCRQGGEAMPVAQACFVVMKVCEGLDYAHNKRDQSGRELSLVHRDVSPQNVLVSFEGEVKLIDFGIAKAAGKGSKTQAGILKGKFGYMSPEQVRGLPIDRRSDVFSCGIVLYELLTGERLFVGESDFSTLEKVRNVEILPPSTYNRKIPDELERIVLKALAKDTEDRYQNAIDLHDELQAFVYTSGEFYSRKDLAGWMKKTFGKEIEDETAKLESYRQLKPPPTPSPDVNPTPAVSRTSTGGHRTVGASPSSQPPPVRRSTQGGAMGTKPPPPPAGRPSGQMQAAPSTLEQPTSRVRKEDGLSWDDDELETQIYDNPEDDPKLRVKAAGKALPLVAAPTADGEPSPAATIRGVPLAPSDVPSLASANSATASPTMTGPAPDLSSLVSTAKGWESGALGAPVAPAAATMNGMGPGPALNGAVAPHGSAPFIGGFEQAPADRSAPFDPMATFGSSLGLAQQKRARDRRMMFLGIAGAAVAVGAVIAVIAVTGGEKSTTTSTASTQPAPPTPPTPDTAASDQNTGFDLYVQPAGVTQWKLDGEARSDKLPLQIRNVTPGPHTVQIEAPPGFMSQSRQVTVERGKAPKVEIVLTPIAGIHGIFDSTPPGATVSLIIDGKRETLGPSPVKAPLDPRLTYQVLFEKSGYVSVNRPVVFTGALEEKIVVPLEKASGTPAVAVTEPVKPETPPVQPPKQNDPKPKTGPVTQIKDNKPVTRPEPKPDVKPDPKPDPKPEPVAKGNGVLKLGAKPRCEIYIDGSSTGLFTPQLDLKLSAGKHRITLVNNEFGIRESFSVDIKADATEKVTKDYSDRLPK